MEKLIVHYLRTTHLTRKTVVRSISSGPLRQTDRYISVHAHGVMTTPESNEMATLPPPAEQPTATTTTTSTTATTASTHTPIAASMASASENTAAPASTSTPSAPSIPAQSQPQQPDESITAAPATTSHAPLERKETEAIGAAAEDGTSAAPKVDPDAVGETVQLTLLLTSGKRHPYKIDAKYLRKRGVSVEENNPWNLPVVKLKELILRDWREGEFDYLSEWFMADGRRGKDPFFRTTRPPDIAEDVSRDPRYLVHRTWKARHFFEGWSGQTFYERWKDGSVMVPSGLRPHLARNSWQTFYYEPDIVHQHRDDPKIQASLHHLKPQSSSVSEDPILDQELLTNLMATKTGLFLGETGQWAIWDPVTKFSWRERPDAKELRRREWHRRLDRIFKHSMTMLLCCARSEPFYHPCCDFRRPT